MRRVLKKIDLDPVVLPRLQMHAQRITAVHPCSPAEVAGLRVGWEALLAGEKAPTGGNLKSLRVHGADSYLFYDPVAHQAYELAGGAWPFGLQLTGVGTQGFLERIRIRDNVDHDLYEAFGRGELDEFTLMIEPLREALMPMLASTFAPLLTHTRRNKEIAKSDDYSFLGFLALGYLANNDFDQARFFIEATWKQMERSGQRSFSLRLTALLYYVEARLFWAKGDREHAIRSMDAALDDAPQFEVLRDDYAIWTDSPPLLYVPRWVGEEVPLDYCFPQYDPLNFWPSGDTVSLQKTVNGLGSQQIIIVFFMPGYRANYYYNQDLMTLAALHRYDPNRIAEVHVLSNSKYLLDRNHRAEAEGIAKSAGLPVKFLWCENADVENGAMIDFAEGLDLYRSPTALVVGQGGVVLANGVFSDESAYWSALARI